LGSATDADDRAVVVVAAAATVAMEVTGGQGEADDCEDEQAEGTA